MMNVFSVVRVMLIAALTAAAFTPMPRPATAAGNGTWVQQAPKGAPAAVPQLLEMQCPSAAVCYALGSAPSSDPSQFGQAQAVIEKTTDGGVTWSSQKLNLGLGMGPTPVSLACPGVDVCYLPGTAAMAPQRKDEILATADGGRTWSVAYSGTWIELGPVVCPGPTACDVGVFHEGTNISEALLSTSDGGKTWTERAMSVTDQPLTALTCPDANDCYLAGLLRTTGSVRSGGLATSHDGGRTWSRTTVPAGEYTSIACPGADHCYALLFPQNGGATALATRDGGRTWSTLPISAAQYAPGGQILCPSDTLCYVLWAGGVWRSSDAGATWHPASGAGMLPTAASCPSSTTCYGVGFQSLILKTTDGKTWREPTPYTRLPLSALACPGAGTCYAVGAGGLLLTTSDGGASWVRRSTGATGALPSIACPSLGVCLTTDLVFTPPSTTTGVMLRTTDGGQTWSTEKGIPATRVTCPSSTVCYATGATFTGSGSPPTAVVLRSSDAGRTWAKESTLPKGYTLTAIACSSTTTCIGVGGESPCIDDLARRDMRPLGSDTVGLRPDQQGCREAGWLFSTADGGRHWVRQFHRTLAPGTTGADLLTAGCPTPTLCYAAGYGIWIRATFASRGWTVKLDGVTPIDFVQSLSCLPPNTCWGIGVKLNSLGGVPVRTTNGGASWQVIDGNVPSPGSFPQAGGLTALDCPSPTRCFAVGNSGLIMAYSP